jgi:hypothetical protein
MGKHEVRAARNNTECAIRNDLAQALTRVVLGAGITAAYAWSRGPIPRCERLACRQPNPCEPARKMDGGRPRTRTAPRAAHQCPGFVYYFCSGTA